MAPCSPTDASEVLAPRNFSIPVRVSPNFALCSVSYTISRVPRANLCILTYERYSEHCDLGKYRYFFSGRICRVLVPLSQKEFIMEFRNLCASLNFSGWRTFYFRKVLTYISSGQHALPQFTGQMIILFISHFPQCETGSIYADVIAPHHLLITSNLTNSIEKPPASKLLKNLPKFYWSRRFISVFTRTRHCTLSWARW
jgi:hypothetical protein